MLSTLALEHTKAWTPAAAHAVALLSVAGACMGASVELGFIWGSPSH
jgi:hypothetical protein